MSSAARLADVLGLFTLRRAAWTPLAAGQALGISRASAYRYFSILLEQGFIIDAPGRQYVLGPRIIELDRQIRLADPLIQVAVDEMTSLVRKVGGLGVALLCRLSVVADECVPRSVPRREGIAEPLSLSTK